MSIKAYDVTVRLSLIVLFLVFSLSNAFSAATQLPKTGQTTSYADGDDGYFRAGTIWPSTRFSVSGDCVTDNLTGLMWTKNAKNANKQDKSMKWQDALNLANKLSICGYDDWRLPSINELESLVDLSKYNSDEKACMGDATQCTPSLPDGHPFTNVQADGYWSSTSHAKFTDSAWYVNMFDGSLVTANKWNYFYAWPVRGGLIGPFAASAVWRTGQTKCYDSWGTVIACGVCSLSQYNNHKDCDDHNGTWTGTTGQDGDIMPGVAWPDTRFSVGTGAEADCVTDNLTGLIWARNVNLPNGYQTWEQALEYLNKLSLCGHSDWRLPNRKEFLSLYDYSNFSPSLPTGHPFSNISSLFNEQLFFWSSTTYAHNTGKAWFAFVSSDYELVCPDCDYTSYKYDANMKRWVCNNGVYFAGDPPCCVSPYYEIYTYDSDTGTRKYACGSGVYYDGDPSHCASPNFYINDNVTGAKRWICTNGAFYSYNTDKKRWMCSNGTYNDDPNYGQWLCDDSKKIWKLVNYGAENSYIVKSDNSSLYGSYVWPVRGGLVGPLSNPDISVTPDTKDFGSVRAGISSTAQSFTIKNAGVGDLVISSISVTGGDSLLFSLGAGTCSSLAPTLASGSSCAFTVTFKPDSAGKKTAAMTISSNVPHPANLDIALSGTGSIPYALTVISSGSGSGSVTGPGGLSCSWDGKSSSGTCEVPLDASTAVTASATADAGSSFTGWLNGTGSASKCAGIDSCQFTISSDSAIEVLFSADEACNCTLSPQKKTFGYSAGKGSIRVKAVDACNWTAESDSDWINISSGNSSEEGNRVVYSVSANNSKDQRYGSIIIGDQTFDITQNGAPCRYTVSPASGKVGVGGGSGSFTLGSPDGCDWTAYAVGTADSWITLDPSEGSGSGTVNYTVSPNSGKARTGKINIVGGDGKVKKTFAIKQSSM